jgi:hypothetical protein
VRGAGLASSGCRARAEISTAALQNDPEDPMNWPKSRKWRMTILLCLMTLFIGLATSAFSVGIDEMCAEFGVDSEVGQVGMFVVRPLVDAFARWPPRHRS